MISTPILTAGAGLLFAIDLTFNDAAITRLPEWTVVKIGLVTALAYVTGQLIAGLSSLLLEHWLARRILRDPVSLQLNFTEPRRREWVVGKYVVGRYYEALPPAVREKVLRLCAKGLETAPGGCGPAQVDDIFQWCFARARQSSDAAARLGEFLKLYGFNRNVALVGLIAALLFLSRATLTGEVNFFLWSGLSLVIAFGCLTRFLKFYAAYSAEVLRGCRIEGPAKTAPTASSHGPEDF